MFRYVFNYLKVFPMIICKPTLDLGTYLTSKAGGVTIREKLFQNIYHFLPSVNRHHLMIMKR
jgi:hypothetical protein